LAEKGRVQTNQLTFFKFGRKENRLKWKD